ncbi:hypothetical protein GCM10028808_57030 [Spirosoma migulaei]
MAVFGFGELKLSSDDFFDFFLIAFNLITNPVSNRPMNPQQPTFDAPDEADEPYVQVISTEEFVRQVEEAS